MWRVYGKDFDDALSDWWMGRVIGNIYENPEPQRKRAREASQNELL